MRPGFVLLLAAGCITAAVRPDGTFHAVYRGAAADFTSIAVSEGGAPQIILPVTDPAVRTRRQRRAAGRARGDPH